MSDKNGQLVAGGNGAGNRLDQLRYPTNVLSHKQTDSLIICDYENERLVQWYRRTQTTQGKILNDQFGCWGLAMDEQNYLYVSDGGKHEVRRYQLEEELQDETVIASWNGGHTVTGYFSYYIFVDRQQTLYVSELINHRVMKWSKGAKKGIVVAGGHGEGNDTAQFSRPRGLFFDAIGTFYVADGGNRRITRWPQGALQGTIILESDTQLSSPMDLSVDLHGNLYVVDRNNHRIERFSIQ